MPVIAIAAPVPAFAGASQGTLQLDGTGCKLPGNSNDTYKGYAFGLSATNTTANFQCVHVIGATLNGVDLGAVTVVNLNTCQNLTSTFCLNPVGQAGASLNNLALMTANAPNSQNGQLVVTYEVRENAGSCACSGFGEDLTASTGVNDVPPINGASCSTFSKTEKDCLASKAL